MHKIFLSVGKFQGPELCGWTGRDGRSGPKRLLEVQAGDQQWESFTTTRSYVVRAGRRARNEACTGSESASPLPLEIGLICNLYKLPVEPGTRP